MTTDEKRIKIAEACGWQAVGMGFLEHCTGFGDNLLIGYYGGSRKAVPDYFIDLTAMHEAEKVLTPLKFESYRWILWDMCKHSQVTEWNRSYLCATSEQRAEAFGKTLNLW